MREPYNNTLLNELDNAHEQGIVCILSPREARELADTIRYLYGQSQNAARPQGDKSTERQLLEALVTKGQCNFQEPPCGNCEQCQLVTKLLTKMVFEAAESDPSGDSSAEKGTRNSEKRT